ncbi:hypothetical protein EZBTHKR_0642 [Elizabethkingia anophelis]|nr:hypothetical protein EZBTHKR_0642 [Elizabethkingia anophelis]
MVFEFNPLFIPADSDGFLPVHVSVYHFFPTPSSPVKNPYAKKLWIFT